MARNKTTLVAASREWASRPADQRFWTVQELYNRAKQYAGETAVKPVDLTKCQVVPMPGDDMGLAGPTGNIATFQHFSFNQLCGLVRSPASFLQELPADLASPVLTHRLQQLPEKESLLMFHKNGGLQLRCVTSEQYSRIWNYEVAEMALALEEQEGWITPPARPCGIEGVPTRIATKNDVLHKSAHPELGIRVGQEISPAGLYCSDHDLFIFQVNEDRPIDGGDGEVMYRGVFWSNSEVGDARFKGTMFLYDSVCGNHIVWGAKVVAEISIRHTGNAAELFRESMVEAIVGMHRTASEDERRIKAAKEHVLGPGKTEIVKMIFGKSWGLSKQQCEDAYTLAERHAESHGNDPNTAWGYAAGITRLSQQQWADKRDVMDRAAGKVMELAF